MTLEQRVTQLEKELADLKRQLEERSKCSNHNFIPSDGSGTKYNPSSTTISFAGFSTNKAK